MRRTAEHLEAAQHELARLKDDHSRIEAENITLQRQLDRQNDEKNALLRSREVEFSKGKEFQASVYDMEARNRNKEDMVMSLRKEMDDVRFSNSSMQDRLGGIKQEIEALSTHCRVLEHQNHDLNKELEHFVQTDE